MGRIEDPRCVYGGIVDTVEHTVFECGKWEKVRLKCKRKFGDDMRPETIQNILCGLQERGSARGRWHKENTDIACKGN